MTTRNYRLKFMWLRKPSDVSRRVREERYPKKCSWEIEHNVLVTPLTYEFLYKQLKEIFTDEEND